MKNVLVVDNNPKELITFQEWFKVIYNFDVAISSDGEKAIAILDKEEINVFCTGIDVPKIDGIELLAHMTRTHPETPCIVMSEHGVPWFREKPDRQDILYHIEKPVSPEALTTAIFVGLVLKDEGVSFKGISMRSFLPLVWKSRKTCCIEIESHRKEEGYIHFDNGRIVGAGYQDFIGKRAILEMAAWEGIKLQISNLPEERPDNPDPIDLLEVFDIAWFGERPSMIKKESGVDGGMDQQPQPDNDKDESAKTVEALIEKAADVLKKVIGYQAIGILSSEGNLLASESVGDLDFDSLRVAFKKIVTMSSHAFGEKVLGEYEGLTVHTKAHTLIFLSVSTGYHIIVVLKPNSNWYFAKCRIETGLLKDLEWLS